MSFLNHRPNPHKFHPSTSIPPLTSRVILVTGGNNGIGLQTVLQLSQHNPARIYLACRSQAKYDIALSGILKSNPKAKSCVACLELDLTSFDSIKAAVRKVSDENNRLDLLINNAGIMGAPPGTTKEGYESHFGVNYLGHALLTTLLLPLLQRTASRTDIEEGSVRVVNVSSMGYAVAPNAKDPSGIDLSDSVVKSNGNGMHSYPLYGRSKLANILFAKGAARRWGDSGVVSVAVHPGRVQTGLLDGFFKAKRWDFWSLFQKGYDMAVGPMGVEEGAYTQLWAATAPIASDETKKGHGVVNGAFYVPIGLRGDEGVKKLNDEVAARKLWEWMEAQFKEHGIQQ